MKERDEYSYTGREEKGRIRGREGGRGVKGGIMTSWPMWYWHQDKDTDVHHWAYIYKVH